MCRWTACLIKQTLKKTPLMNSETKTVRMTAEEAAQYEAFKAKQARKAAAEKARKTGKSIPAWSMTK